MEKQINQQQPPVQKPKRRINMKTNVDKFVFIIFGLLNLYLIYNYLKGGINDWASYKESLANKTNRWSFVDIRGKVLAQVEFACALIIVAVLSLSTFLFIKKKKFNVSMLINVVCFILFSIILAIASFKICGNC